jgi:hypothetical protein
MAAFAPNLRAEDFQALDRYHIYTSFNQDGRNTGFISGVTMPATKPLRNPEELRAKSMARYGKPGAEVEREHLELLAGFNVDVKSKTESGTVGRRKKL